MGACQGAEIALFQRGSRVKAWPWRRRSWVDAAYRERGRGAAGIGWTLPIARETTEGAAGLGARPPARRVEGLPSWAPAASCEGGLRRDAPGGRCLSRDPSTLPAHGRRRRERETGGRPIAIALPIGREVHVAGRILVAPRDGARRCPPRTPAASSERGTLDKQPNVSIQSWAPNLARECGQDSVTIGCNALFGTEGDGRAFQSLDRRC